MNAPAPAGTASLCGIRLFNYRFFDCCFNSHRLLSAGGPEWLVPRANGNFCGIASNVIGLYTVAAAGSIRLIPPADHTAEIATP